MKCRSVRLLPALLRSTTRTRRALPLCALPLCALSIGALSIGTLSFRTLSFRALSIGALSIGALSLQSIPCLAAPDAGSAELPAGESLPSRVKPQPLPRLPEDALTAPNAKQRQQLSDWMLSLRSTDKTVAFGARARIAQVRSTLLPSIAQRLKRLANTSHRKELKSLLTEVRRLARAELRRLMAEKQRQGIVTTPDYLEMLLDYRGPRSQYLAPLIEILACSRMLESIGSVHAVRQLIGIYVRFGEFLRVDTQMALTRLGDRSLAALITTTRHPAPRIARWAEHRLQAAGHANASDAIVGLPEQSLPGVLRAYGKIRSLSAFRLLLSYASSDRPAIRLAARQSITHIGQAGLWQLRDAYETTLGSRAPDTWSWDRVARTLFAQYDQTRLAQLYQLFDQGRAATAQSHWIKAAKFYDHVLALDPHFESASKMLTSYWRFAQVKAATDPAQASLALRRIERLAGADHPLHGRAKSLRYTLDAERLLTQGWVDQVLLHRALQLDADNQRARQMIDKLSAPVKQPFGAWTRYLPSALIALLTGVALAYQLRLFRDVKLTALSKH